MKINILFLLTLLFAIPAIGDTTTTLSQRATGQTITQDFFNDIINSLNGTLVPRHATTGAPTSGSDLGSATYPWGRLYSTDAQMSGLTASRVVASDASKNLSSATTTLTEVQLLSGVTGTTGSGNMVLSASPTLTGTIAAASQTLSGTLGVTGNAGFGGAQATNARVYIRGTSSTGTTVWGAFNDFAASSSTTSAAYGYHSGITTTAASYVLTRRAQFYAADVAKGAGSTITNDIAYLADFPTQGGTANVAFTDTAAPGASYGLYLATANPSLIAGVINSTNTTDATSSAGGILSSGGISMAKKLYVGTQSTHIGAVGIGNAPDLTSAFIYAGANAGVGLTGTTQGALWIDAKYDPSVATVATNVYTAQPRTTAVAATIPTGRGYHVLAASLGAGSAYTRLINYGGIAQTAATNNAFLSDNITFTGNWFINQTGTTASSLGGALNVAGAFTVPGLATSSAATTGTMCWTTGTGNVNVDTTTTCLLSTKKIKQRIRPIEVGIEEVMKLTPISYELKPKNNPMKLGRMIGFISEDVEKIDDRLISRDENGEPLGVRYMQLTALLTKAIQQQQAKIDKLESIVNQWE